MDLSALLQQMTQQTGDPGSSLFGPTMPFQQQAPPPMPPMPQAMPEAAAAPGFPMGPPPPMSPPPQNPLGFEQQQGPDWKAHLPQILMALAGLGAAGNNPLGAAAYMHGFQQTQLDEQDRAAKQAELDARRVEREDALNRLRQEDEQKRKEYVATATMNALEKGSQFETPEEQAQFFARIAPVLAPLGIDARALAGMPNPAGPKRLIKEAQDSFDAAVKGLKTQGVDLTAPDAYKQYSVRFRGKTISLDDLATIAGLPVAGADAPRTADEASYSKDAYGARLRREILAKEKALGRPLTNAEINQTDDTLRTDYTRKDDAAQNGILQQIRAMELAQLQSNAAHGGLKPLERMQSEAELRKEWQKATLPLRTMEQQLALMRTGYKRAVEGNDWNGGSQAVLVTFQKILDPNSVVRESEYARTADGQSILNQLRGRVEAAQHGGAKLTPQELAGLLGTAEQFVKTARDYMGPTRRTAMSAINEWGLNPSNIFNETQEETPTPSVLPRVGDIRSMKNGTKVKITSVKPDGTLSWEEVP